MLTSISVIESVDSVFKPSLKVNKALAPPAVYKSNISSVLLSEAIDGKTLFGLFMSGSKSGYVKLLIPTLNVPTPFPVAAAADLPTADKSIVSISVTFIFCLQE